MDEYRFILTPRGQTSIRELEMDIRISIYHWGVGEPDVLVEEGSVSFRMKNPPRGLLEYLSDHHDYHAVKL